MTRTCCSGQPITGWVGHARSDLEDPPPRRRARAAALIGHGRRRGSAGGRPPKFDPVDYRDWNVVADSVTDFTRWRGHATRYDTLAVVYRAAAVLNARHLLAPTAARRAPGADGSTLSSTHLDSHGDGERLELTADVLTEIP